MAFTAPTKQQLFALEHFAGIGELAEHAQFEDASEDMVQAIVEGIASLAEGEWAPLNRIGDLEGAKLVDHKVTLPDGFAEAYRDFAEGGWAGITVPQDHGGQGMPFSLGMVVLETLGAANCAFTLCPTLSLGAVEALDAHGSDEQKAAYLPKLASGDWTGTMNLTEPQAGSDVGALTATAKPLGDGKYQIEGQKIYISWGDHELAENIVHLVLARTPDGPKGTKGISLFIVPKYRLDENGEPGERQAIQTVSLEHKMGLNASPTCVLQFGSLPDGSGEGECIGELIGEEFGGMRAMFTMMNNARINVGLQGLQISEPAMQKAIEYALERKQSARAGGDPSISVAIEQHPDVRRMLMRMKAGVEAMRALCYFTAGQVDRAELGLDEAKGMPDLLTPLVKGYCTDLANEIASLGIQVHGGMGYIEETGAAQYYRDARIFAIYEGTNGIQAADLVGRKLGMGGGDLLRGFLKRMADDVAEESALAQLVAECDEVAGWMLEASIDDRLAGSVPFLEMMAVATCGWLLLKQETIAKAAMGKDGADTAFLTARAAAARTYLDLYVPEALGQKALAMAGADLLYTLDADELAS